MKPKLEQKIDLKNTRKLGKSHDDSLYLDFDIGFIGCAFHS